MAYSRDSYTGDGSTTDYSVTFPYLQKSHVKVYLDESLTSDWSWVNSSTIRFDSAPGSGVSILIKRQTSPATRLVDYQTPSSLNEEDLDRDSLQAFYLQQEALDEVATVLAENLSGQFDAESKRIINVADPTSAQDAATKSWVDSTYSDAVTEAENWATYAEDSPVPEGNGSEFSAYHWAQKADDSETAAATSESNAATSESNAATSESNAATSASNASDSEDKANLWAEEAEDVEVETGEYSAYHWAQKAMQANDPAAVDVSFDDNSFSFTAANVQAALEALDSGKLALSGGTLTGNLTISNTAPKLVFSDTSTGADAEIEHNSGRLAIKPPNSNKRVRFFPPDVSDMTEVSVRKGGAQHELYSRFDKASAADFRSKTDDKVLEPTGVWNAADEVTLTDASTISVDMSTFINATVTLADNRTLGNPSNAKVGQSGCIRIVQDGTGNRTLGYGANWVFAGGETPVLSTAASAEDLLFYYVVNSTKIYASLVKAVS